MRLKKYFYALRPILACRWILTRQTPPPMRFTELAAACLDEAMVPAVSELLRRKTDAPEVGLVPRIDAINRYLDDAVAELEQQIRTLPEEEPADWAALNALFLRALRAFRA